MSITSTLKFHFSKSLIEKLKELHDYTSVSFEDALKTCSKKTCEHCGVEFPDNYYMKIIIDENDNKRKVCDICKSRYTVSCVLIKHGENRRLIQAHVFNRNPKIISHNGSSDYYYIPEKDLLENWILQNALVKESLGNRFYKHIEGYNNDIEDLSMFTFGDNLQISYELIKLIYDICEKFNIICENIRGNLINAFTELNIKMLYIRRDPYYYYLPSNRTIENTEELETKGVKSKKWTNLFRLVFNTEDSRVLEDCTRFAKTRLENIQHLAREIKVTNDINDVYCMDGLNSCMSNKKYTKFYADARQTDNDIQIAYMINKDNEVIGRALLWNTVTCTTLDQTIKVMDRIYTKGDQGDDITKAFKYYAKTNGYYYKLKQDYCNKDEFINPETQETECLTLEYKTKKYLDEYDYAPYIDTLTYGNSKTLTNNDTGSEYTFTSTDGEIDRCGFVCAVCGEIHGEDEIQYVEDYNNDVCDDCLDNDSRFFYCEYCNEYHYGEISYDIETGNKRGYTTCRDGLEAWDYVLDIDGDPIPLDEAIFIDGEYYYQDSTEGEYFYCEGTGDYYFFEKTEHIEDNNGHYYSEYAIQYEEIKQELENNKQLQLEGISND